MPTITGIQRRAAGQPVAAPLRIAEGKTCVAHDRPSSLFGQFGEDRIGPTAAMLD
jgi:hypothetical protein